MGQHRPLTRRGSARARAAAALLVGVLALTGCSDDEVAAPPTTVADTPEPSTSRPEPTPTVELTEVRGERSTAQFSLDAGSILGLEGGPAPDGPAIESAVRTIGDWLDRHLDSLQRTGEGRLGEIAADDLVGGRQQRRMITTALASPDAPVASARYTLSAYHDGAPEFVSARVEVTHPDDSVARLAMVFLVNQAGEPVLTLFGPDVAGGEG